MTSWWKWKTIIIGQNMPQMDLSVESLTMLFNSINLSYGQNWSTIWATYRLIPPIDSHRPSHIPTYRWDFLPHFMISRISRPQISQKASPGMRMNRSQATISIVKSGKLLLVTHSIRGWRHSRWSRSYRCWKAVYLLWTNQERKCILLGQ
jgi:hypothetical protein